MTVLIISVPPMAAMFFNGTMGSFMPYAALGGGAAAARPGPQGPPPGSYGYGGGGGPDAQPASNTAQINPQNNSNLSASNAVRMPGNTSIAQPEVIKTSTPPTPREP